MKHYYMPNDVYLKRLRYMLGLNPVRIPSSFIIKQLAKTRRST